MFLRNIGLTIHSNLIHLRNIFISLIFTMPFFRNKKPQEKTDLMARQQALEKDQTKSDISFELVQELYEMPIKELAEFEKWTTPQTPLRYVVHSIKWEKQRLKKIPELMKILEQKMPPHLKAQQRSEIIRTGSAPLKMLFDMINVWGASLSDEHKTILVNLDACFALVDLWNNACIHGEDNHITIEKWHIIMSNTATLQQHRKILQIKENPLTTDRTWLKHAFQHMWDNLTIRYEHNRIFFMIPLRSLSSHQRIATK